MNVKNVGPIAIDPAVLRHRIDLMRPLFDQEKPWLEENEREVVATIWAGIVKLNAAGRFEAEQASTNQKIRFVIRHRDDMQGVTHLAHAGSLFVIEAMSDPDQTARWLVLETRSALGDD